MKKISVICPVYNEEKYIKQCIESLLDQDFDWSGSEILFIDGMSSDKSRDIINEFARKNNFIKIIDNPKKITSSALNIGIKFSKNRIIFRIDAHTRYPQNYFAKLSELLIKLKADNVGGVCKTLPGGPGLIPSSIAKAMSSAFGIGNSFFRIGSKQIRKVDTVPFGCFNRDIFDKIGFFDEELIRNQDDEFNGRIIRNGGNIYLIPDVIIEYYARNKIQKMFQMFYQYGLFKPLVNKKLGFPASIRQFIPPLFVLWIIAGIILSIFYNKFLIIYFLIFVLYLALSLSFSFKLSKNLLQFLFLPFIFFIIHFSYGWGYVNGIIRFIILRSTSINIGLSR